MKHMHSHGAQDVQNFVQPTRTVKILGIEHGMKVADFGAGSGAYALAIAEHLSGSGMVYAVDVQKDLLRRLKNDAHKRGLKNIDVIWADLEQVGSSKIRQHTVDVVLLSNLLFQVPDKIALLKEAVRIVKKSGRVVVIDWIDSFGGLGPHKDDVLTKVGAKALVRQVGLHVAEEFDAGAHHYGLMCIPHDTMNRTP